MLSRSAANARQAFSPGSTAVFGSRTALRPPRLRDPGTRTGPRERQPGLRGWGIGTTPIAGVYQGGPDGRSADGEDDYPRQDAGAAPAPAPGGPAPAPTPAAGTYPNPPTVPDILADTVMSAQLDRAWTESLPNAPDVPNGSPGSLTREQGGWFLWRRDSHILQSIRVGAGTRDGLGTIVGTRPPDSNIQLVVAWYHTHPNTSAEGYGSAASAGDINWQNAEALVPGIIMTHDGVVTIPYP